MNDFSNNFKIIVIGDSGTGKTSFANKWTKNFFTDTYEATNITEFNFKVFEYQGKRYRIQLQDIPSISANPTEAKVLISGTHGCVVMTDATNIETREK